MARIAGIDLPKNKRGVIGLTYIYGIGSNKAAEILDKSGISQDKKVSDWNLPWRCPACLRLPPSCCPLWRGRWFPLSRVVSVTGGECVAPFEVDVAQGHHVAKA